MQRQEGTRRYVTDLSTPLAVVAILDDDGGDDKGVVWILFMDTNGKVKSFQKISDTEGDFGGVLDDFDYFGISVASIRDLDGVGYLSRQACDVRS